MNKATILTNFIQHINTLHKSTTLKATEKKTKMIELVKDLELKDLLKDVSESDSDVIVSFHNFAHKGRGFNDVFERINNFVIQSTVTLGLEAVKVEGCDVYFDKVVSKVSEEENEMNAESKLIISKTEELAAKLKSISKSILDTYTDTGLASKDKCERIQDDLNHLEDNTCLFEFISEYGDDTLDKAKELFKVAKKAKSAKAKYQGSIKFIIELAELIDIVVIHNKHDVNPVITNIVSRVTGHFEEYATNGRALHPVLNGTYVESQPYQMPKAIENAFEELAKAYATEQAKGKTTKAIRNALIKFADTLALEDDANFAELVVTINGYIDEGSNAEAMYGCEYLFEEDGEYSQFKVEVEVKKSKPKKESTMVAGKRVKKERKVGFPAMLEPAMLEDESEDLQFNFEDVTNGDDEEDDMTLEEIQEVEAEAIETLKEIEESKPVIEEQVTEEVQESSEPKVYGYLGHNEDADMKAVIECDVYKEEWNKETSTLSRPTLIKLVKSFNEGDTLVLNSVDSLRKTNDVQWSVIKSAIVEKKVNVILLDQPMTHTPNPLLIEFVISLIDGLVKSEALQRKKVQGLGIKSAKNNGIKLGRPRNTEQREFIKECILEGQSWTTIQNNVREKFGKGCSTATIKRVKDEMLALDN